MKITPIYSDAYNNCVAEIELELKSLASLHTDQREYLSDPKVIELQKCLIKLHQSNFPSKWIIEDKNTSAEEIMRMIMNNRIKKKLSKKIALSSLR